MNNQGLLLWVIRQFLDIFEFMAQAMLVEKYRVIRGIF